MLLLRLQQSLQQKFSGAGYANVAGEVLCQQAARLRAAAAAAAVAECLRPMRE